MPDQSEILKELNVLVADGKTPQNACAIVRNDYLKRLHTKRNRNVIAYYSGWLSPSAIPNDPSLIINDLDKNGFMNCIHKMDRSIGLDLILHLPGGNIAATETIIDYLRAMFAANIETFIPQLSMSGGTMLSLIGNTIHMGKQSNLGPIDPQFGNISAVNVVEELDTALKEVVADNNKMVIWGPVLNKIAPGQIQMFRKAIEWSRVIGEQALCKGMFVGDVDAKTKIEAILQTLTTDSKKNLAHDRHFHVEELQAAGLKITKLESDPDLQDIILSVHHAFMISLINERFSKLIENHMGKTFQLQAA